MALLQRCIRLVPSKVHRCRRMLHSTSRRDFIPFVTESTGRSERVSDIFSHLLGERIICVMSPITDPVAGSIIAQLLHLQASDKKQTIHMYINCAGGLVSSTLGIYDTMQFIKCPIATWCVGQANDMGSLLLAAGSGGMRYALPHSRIMLRQPISVLSGQASDIEIQAEEISRILEEVSNIYAKHTGRHLEDIDEAIQRHKFMDAQAAKDFGLIDKVLEYPTKSIVKPPS